MTVNPSIDPARLLEEQLAQASPDLLRELLQTLHQHPALGRGRRGLRCGVRHGQHGADQPPQRLPAS
jgi:putative transposase